MNCRVLVGMLGLFAVGCAQTGAPIPRLGRALPRAEMTPLPSIREAIDKRPTVSAYKTILPKLPSEAQVTASAPQPATTAPTAPAETTADADVGQVSSAEEPAPRVVAEPVTPPIAPTDPAPADPAAVPAAPPTDSVPAAADSTGVNSSAESGPAAPAIGSSLEPTTAGPMPTAIPADPSASEPPAESQPTPADAIPSATPAESEPAPAESPSAGAPAEPSAAPAELKPGPVGADAAPLAAPSAAPAGGGALEVIDPAEHPELRPSDSASADEAPPPSRVQPVSLPPTAANTTRDAAKPSDSDPAIKRASTDAETSRADAEAKAEAEIRSGSALKTTVNPGKLLGMSVATVGTEAISRHQLQRALDEYSQANIPPNTRLGPDEIEMLAEHLLEDLIKRSLIIQEAKRTFLKSDKQMKSFNDFADKRWREEEFPKLLRKYEVKSEAELNRALARKGRSVKSLMEAYRMEQLKTEFVRGRLASRLKAGYPELKAYYQAHIQNYDRPAQVTWREIMVKTDQAGDPTGARRTAEAALARIKRGEDFVAVAKAVSQGPTAADGGKRVTEPKASAAPAVNAALETLVPGQVSAVLEGPGGFYVVRVDERRAAGPAPFPDVQKQVFAAWFEENFERELDSYLKKLRSQTIVTYWRSDGGKKPDPTVEKAAQRTKGSP